MHEITTDPEGLKRHIKRRLTYLQDDGERNGYTPWMDYELATLMLAVFAMGGLNTREPDDE